jgi:glycosyltransferase involved in cell wall biosynthesis
MNFSVLMSIYHKEKAEYFDRAMLSIWDEQTVKPSEIILVEDGKLTNELYDSIHKWKNKLGDIFKTILLEKNMGLGVALNRGLETCRYTWIARMDTDDIAMPNRFKMQMEYLDEHSDIDILGAAIAEFSDEATSPSGYRKLPQTHSEIVKFAKYRNPMNHMAVMFRKSSVIVAGGYLPMRYFEDYYLWIRMILGGSKFYNMQEVLVNARAGVGQLERRSGFAYVRAEMNFLNQIRKIGFINNFEFVRNIMIRFSARVMPRFVIHRIYRILRK